MQSYNNFQRGKIFLEKSEIVSISLFTFALVMLGQASAIKVRNQVSEYPPLSKLAGCFFIYHGIICKDKIYFKETKETFGKNEIVSKPIVVRFEQRKSVFSLCKRS